mmetsp:Transcript_29754/g.68515  ORF Transcript_29754/g.68515 Transcript_29754/m.68515 type:complete len:214 (+) Transcript_29754:729-1370(+)
MPTFAPFLLSSKARFTATALFPTPPLHEETAITLFTFAIDGGGGNRCGCCDCSGGTGSDSSSSAARTSTELTHGICFRVSRTWSLKMLTSSFNVTIPRSLLARTSPTKPADTMSVPRPSSVTVFSTLSTSSSALSASPDSDPARKLANLWSCRLKAVTPVKALLPDLNRLWVLVPTAEAAAAAPAVQGNGHCKATTLFLAAVPAGTLLAAGVV